jgi:hypothetical protein
MSRIVLNIDVEPVDGLDEIAVTVRGVNETTGRWTIRTTRMSGELTRVHPELSDRQAESFIVDVLAELRKEP